MTRRPLEGLRVIELADEQAEWAGKLLADMGADVVKIERPEGDAQAHSAVQVVKGMGIREAGHRVKHQLSAQRHDQVIVADLTVVDDDPAARDVDPLRLANHQLDVFAL